MNKIAELRKAAGLTQTDLARKLQITQGTVAMWETGKAVPRTQKLSEIAEILGCTVDELLK